MDGGRFDQFTKLIGASPSRRHVLKALGGGAVTSLAASLGLRETSAAARKRGMGVVCSKNADCTSSACLPKDRTGRRSCGCGAASECPSPADPCQMAICTAGVCGSQVNIGAGCDDGNPCTSGDRCQANGVCVGTPIACPVCQACAGGVCQAVADNTPCGAGQACCGGACIDVTTTANCHTCGVVCPVPANATATCDGANCGFTCRSGDRACGAGCCPSDQVCCNEVCCSVGWVCTGGTCEPCHDPGQACAAVSECCSGICTAGQCGCLRAGASCSSPGQCCYTCTQGVCTCIPLNFSCNTDEQCCSRYCTANFCACIPLNFSCNFNEQCCSGRCTANFCA